MQALKDTLRQVQEIRTYYDFPDIDIDRYEIGGSLREVMLAVRELNVDKLPESSRNWINDKLIYTHGYGITMNPVNGFTPEGLPTLLLSNMPVQSTVPGINVTRPEIYFRRDDEHRRLREDRPAGVQLSRRPDEQPDVVQGRGRNRGGRISAADCAGIRPWRPGEAAFQRRCDGGKPAADAAQYSRSRGGVGAVFDLRPGSVHCGGRRRTAFVDDGRIHFVGQLSVFGAPTPWTGSRSII